mmetsp:Transcript_36976/g.80512  ORF Transcript_36976/g.80512 Transcript_36976/m.80512 type:complete len:258 (+) Transcript_36976:942-1715(+)
MISKITPNRFCRWLSHLAVLFCKGPSSFLCPHGIHNSIKVYLLELVLGNDGRSVRTIPRHNGSHFLRMHPNGNVSFIAKGLGQPTGYARCIKNGLIIITVIIAYCGVLVEDLEHSESKEVGGDVSFLITVLVLNNPNHLFHIIAFLISQHRQRSTFAHQQIFRSLVAPDEQPNLPGGLLCRIIRAGILCKRRRRIVQRWIGRVDGILDGFHRVGYKGIVWIFRGGRCRCRRGGARVGGRESVGCLLGFFFQGTSRLA